MSSSSPSLSSPSFVDQKRNAKSSDVLGEKDIEKLREIIKLEPTKVYRGWQLRLSCCDGGLTMI